MLRKETFVGLVSLMAALSLFLAPWAFGFATVAAAAWTAWISAAALGALALAALCGAGETPWTEGTAGMMGLWTIAAPWLLGFDAQPLARQSHVIPGLVVIAGAAMALIWPRLRRSGWSLGCAALLLACLVGLGTASHAATMEGHLTAERGRDTALTEALNVLAADGWHDISGLQHQGIYVRATAQTRDGRRETVLVDPLTGIVLSDIAGLEGS